MLSTWPSPNLPERAALVATTTLPIKAASICLFISSPQLPPASSPYTLMVAGAIYKAIKNLTLIDVDIKWVNDIYYRHKKIGES